MITEQDIPPHSHLAHFLQDADFQDSYVARNPWPERSALEIVLNTVSRSPVWVNSLMTLRNRIVRVFGLKNLGALHELSPSKAASDYTVGDRVGIFTLLYLSDAEVVLGDHDKHLEVRVSVLKSQGNTQAEFAVSTVVHEHNALGKVYMLFVKPMHKLIVPAVMRRALVVR